MKLDIDFSQHPAFAAYISSSQAGAGEYRRVMGEIDVMSTEIYGPKSSHKTLADRWAQFDSRAQPLRKTFDRLLNADTGLDPKLAPHLKSAFRLAVKAHAKDLELLMTRMQPSFEVNARARECAEQIDAEGTMVWEVPDRWMNPLREFLQEDLDALRRRADDGAGEILVCNPGELQQSLLRDFCVSEGVFDALSALYGVRFSKIGYALHVSHPGDTWYRVYDDLGLPVSDTAQMHYDLGVEVPKAMVYLNDVYEEQGPFSTVPASHKWDDLGFWLSFRKEVTYSLHRFAKDQKYPDVGGNGSPFRNVETRKAFASMPAEIRSTSHPGDQILNGTELSSALMKQERPITGAAGTMGLFTGAHVLHRGGIARKGQRWALQVCFWPEESIKLPSKEELSKSGLAPAKEEKKQTKSFFGSLFSKKDPVASEKKSTPVVPAPVGEAAAKPKAKAAKPPEPTDVYSNKRFSLGLKQILGDSTRLSVVDVGGAVNLQPHWHRFHQVADFTVFEPHEKSYQDLLEQQRSGGYYRAFRYVNEALSGKGGVRTLYMSNVPTGTSLLPPKKGGLSDFPHNSYLYPMTEVPIETTTLEKSLSNAGVSVVHGIKLDTQGTEIEIMEGLGATLSESLLLVEMEIGVVEHYDVPSASLEQAIPFMRSLGLELFDLRTNRFPGNASRLEGGLNKVTELLQCQRSSPALGQRLNEVDAIFFRDPRLFIDGGASSDGVRRLIAMLCVYNLYAEAVFTATYAAEKQILTAEVRDSILKTIHDLYAEASLEVKELEGWLAGRQWQNWGQYMWVPAPSF